MPFGTLFVCNFVILFNQCGLYCYSGAREPTDCTLLEETFNTVVFFQMYQGPCQSEPALPRS